MKISISTSLFEQKSGDYPLDGAIELIHQAGYDTVELSRTYHGLSKYQQQLQSCGIKVWAVHGTVAYEVVSLSEDIRSEAIEKELARMEDAAVYAPCPYVIHYVSRHLDPRINDLWCKSVAELLCKAEELSFNLAVETVPYKPEVDQRYAASKEIADFVRSVDSKYLSICVDLNHSNLNENVIDVARNCSGLISDIHISDNHGVREEHLFPGRGVMDFPAALQALRNAGYTGPLNLECGSPGVPTLEELTGLRLWAEKQSA